MTTATQNINEASTKLASARRCIDAGNLSTALLWLISASEAIGGATAKAHGAEPAVRNEMARVNLEALSVRQTLTSALPTTETHR